VGLALIWTAFYAANDRFLSAANLTNLMLQIAATGTIAVGIVLVLLLGEIDLSAGVVSGLCAAAMAILHVKQGWAPGLAILAGLLAGAAVGTFHGLWITRFRVPSFVVTLAGLLGWQGALLHVLGGTGTVNLSAWTITALTDVFFEPAVAWPLAALATLTHGAALWLERRARAAAGLPLPPLRAPVGRRFGRHVLAVGGNAEAARRAGIGVDRIRLVVFAAGSTFAAAGGILAASRLLAVNQSSGSGDVLLNAIAAAVIGGTSLFGGRGSAWSALLGSLVIGSISNGMDLLALSSSVKFMVTGAVLLVAASIDALSRRKA
jgi:D-xylose transport system permease protein